ncbi:MAG TPA: aquaporin family protein [Saprospiraceae bacterium]|nr:aquaporin family protein [Saprospiraceae bacterium]
MLHYKNIIGELIGTFILVFIGTGSVAVAVLYGNLNLYQIAGIWSIAVILGIYASKNLSNAHLNPAVSFGFLVKKDLSPHLFWQYLLGQFMGGLLAGFAVYFIFRNDITAYEITHHIVRGSETSKQTAMMFGEFYPNPGNSQLKELSTLTAFSLEAIGTFVLMMIILLLTHVKKNINAIIPTLIGLTVGGLIILIAPYTQAGFNPARDFSPRLVSYIMGWGDVVFNLPNFGFLTVYIIAPCVGAGLASYIFYLKSKK